MRKWAWEMSWEVGEAVTPKCLQLTLGPIGRPGLTSVCSEEEGEVGMLAEGVKSESPASEAGKDFQTLNIQMLFQEVAIPLLLFL